MASSFTWLDYSEKERQRILDILTILREHETRDELGIGVVRDAFSDMFFPGTSTIQTRAKYFLFVPWMYKRLEEKKVPSSKIDRSAREEEVRLIYALLKSDDTDGVIGKDAKKNLKRLPSSIYWQGLKSWGIRLYPNSISDYHHSIDAFYRFSRDRSHSYEEEIDGCGRRQNWRPGLPPAPDGFPDKASFSLTEEEASYLKERVLSIWPNTMLAHLLNREEPVGSVAFPWDHPICYDLPEPIRQRLVHARNFSETIHGAALLYNLMLAEKAEVAGLHIHDGGVSYYKEELLKWAGSLQTRRDDLQQWDYKRQFWEIVDGQGAKATGQTRFFISTWIKMALSPETTQRIAEDMSARTLIHGREVRLKGPLARLDNTDALRSWSGEAGTVQLRYRWRQAEKIVSDILLGLRRS